MSKNEFVEKLDSKIKTIMKKNNIDSKLFNTIRKFVESNAPHENWLTGSKVHRGKDFVKMYLDNKFIQGRIDTYMKIRKAINNYQTQYPGHRNSTFKTQNNLSKHVKSKFILPLLDLRNKRYDNNKSTEYNVTKGHFKYISKDNILIKNIFAVMKQVDKDIATGKHISKDNKFIKNYPNPQDRTLYGLYSCYKDRPADKHRKWCKNKKFRLPSTS